MTGELRIELLQEQLFFGTSLQAAQIVAAFNTPYKKSLQSLHLLLRYKLPSRIAPCNTSFADFSIQNVNNNQLFI